MSMSIIGILVASALIMPRTNNETIWESPLAEGEIAHRVVERQGAVRQGRKTVPVTVRASSLAIGGPGGETLEVVDPAALRGYRVETVPRSEYAVAADPGINYDEATDAWSAAGAAVGVHRLVVTLPGYVEIEHVAYDSLIDTVSELNPDPIGYVTLAVTGNVATITFDKRRSEPGRRMEISHLAVRRVTGGDKATVTDLREHVFNLVDDLGPFALGSIRPWASHLYDGNRGEDWARYAARETVHLDGHALTLDERKRYSLVGDAAATNLTLTASGEPVMTVYASGDGKGYEDAFSVAEFRHSETNVFFRYVQDIDGFDADELKVQWRTNLTVGAWADMPPSAYVRRTESEVECAGDFAAGPAFFRLDYAGSVTRTVSVTFSPRVTFGGGIDVAEGMTICGHALTAGKPGEIAVAGDLDEVAGVASNAAATARAALDAATGEGRRVAMFVIPINDGGGDHELVFISGGVLADGVTAYGQCTQLDGYVKFAASAMMGARVTNGTRHADLSGAAGATLTVTYRPLVTYSQAPVRLCLGSGATTNDASAVIVDAAHGAATNADQTVTLVIPLSQFTGSADMSDIFVFSMGNGEGKYAEYGVTEARLTWTGSGLAAWEGFELAASTNNFTATVFDADSATCDSPEPGADGMALFAERGTRPYARVANTGAAWPTNETATEIVALVAATNLVTDGAWLTQANDDLIWTYCRRRGGLPEAGDAGPLWRPVAPVRWYGAWPSWAADLPPVPPPTERFTGNYDLVYETTEGGTNYDVVAWTTVTDAGEFQPLVDLTAEILVVGGGGGGGAHTGAGGGGGGVVAATASLTSGTSYTVTVGDGGEGAKTGDVGANGGASSSFANYAALGGGYGGGAIAPNGGDGANGGGAGAASGTAGGGTSGGHAGAIGRRYDSTEFPGLSTAFQMPGGGGGAASNGSVSTYEQGVTAYGGVGGDGILSTISGEGVYYGCGGGGAANGVTTQLTHGSAGGNGSASGGAGGEAAETTGHDGIANTGCGGGGCAKNPRADPTAHGGRGGSGVVILRIRR